MRIFVPLIWLGLIAAAAPSDPNPTRRFGIRLEAPPSANLESWWKLFHSAGARYISISSTSSPQLETAKRYGLAVAAESATTSIAIDGKDGPWLVRHLVDSAARGKDFLLSVKPPADGSIPKDVERRLHFIGAWLHSNGESILDTTAAPFDRMPFFGRATSKGNVLYLHLYEWPASGKLRLPGLENQITSAQLLAGKGKLRWAREGTDTILSLPAHHSTSAATVLKLTLDSPPRAKPYVLEPAANGILTATAESCEIAAPPEQLVYTDSAQGHIFLSNWIRAIDVPTWKIRLPYDGRYKVEAVYAAGPSSAGVLYTVTVKGRTMGIVKGIVEATKDEKTFQVFPVGEMELEAGPQLLLVQPENKHGQVAMKLEAVTLRRVGD
jgi:alpha-L-fucosidase